MARYGPTPTRTSATMAFSHSSARRLLALPRGAPTLMKCCGPLSRSSSVAARRSSPLGAVRPRPPGPRRGDSAAPAGASRPATRPSGRAEDSGPPRVIPFHHSRPQCWDATQGTDGARGPHRGEQASWGRGNALLGFLRRFDVDATQATRSPSQRVARPRGHDQGERAHRCRLEFTTWDGETFVLRSGDVLVATDDIGSGHKWRLIDGQPW